MAAKRSRELEKQYAKISQAVIALLGKFAKYRLHKKPEHNKMYKCIAAEIPNGISSAFGIFEQCGGFFFEFARYATIH